MEARDAGEVTEGGEGVRGGGWEFTLTPILLHAEGSTTSAGRPRIALVYGREDTGLAEEDILACDKVRRTRGQSRVARTHVELRQTLGSNGPSRHC